MQLSECFERCNGGDSPWWLHMLHPTPVLWTYIDLSLAFICLSVYLSIISVQNDEKSFITRGLILYP